MVELVIGLHGADQKTVRRMKDGQEKTDGSVDDDV